MRIGRELLRYLLAAVRWGAAVFLVYIASLFLRMQPVPGSWVEKAAARYLPTNLVLRCEGAAFGLPGKVRFKATALYDQTRKVPETPLAAFASADFDRFARTLRLTGFEIPRLHDGYYEEGSVAEPLGDGPLGFDFPDLGTLRLELQRPDILGIAPHDVTADMTVVPGSVNFARCHLRWPDVDREMTIDGECLVDLAGRRVKGGVKGLATQAQIRPLIVLLDVPVVLPYMDAFTGVTEPVPSECRWDVNLVNNDFRLDLDLHPTLGAYNGIAMRKVDGHIGLDVRFPGKRMEYDTTIGPITAFDRFGRLLDGTIVFHGRQTGVTLDFNAVSELRFGDTLGIIGYLNRGELGAVECGVSPKISVKGRLAADVRNCQTNDLAGHVECTRGAFFGVQLRNVAVDYSLRGDEVAFDGIVGYGRRGGRFAGSSRLKLPGMTGDGATFSARVDYTGGSVEELSDIFHFDLGERHGKVEGSLELAAPMDTNLLVRGMNGRGKVKVRDGHLAQMKLFMGLTKLLAENVPGVGRIVNQSEATASFVITDGVLVTKDIRIEGSLFSIAAEGRYDMAADDLDFTVRVKFMKDDSVPGLKELVRFLSWPFSKLLMEFRVTGKIDSPQWTYITLLDRVL